MRPQRKHSLSVLPFPPPLPLLGSWRDLVENLLAVPDFQAVQFSTFTFHRFVTTSIKVAKFVAQISHHHWSKTAGTAVNNCHDVCLHLGIIQEQMFLRCQHFFQVCGAHGEQNSQSHLFRQLVSSALSVTLFQYFPGLDGVRRSSILGAFGGDKICLLSSRLLPTANAS